MQFDLIYNVAGEDLLANVPDETSCDTNLARVTIRRDTGGGSYRLAVASNGGALPEAHSQSNPYTRSVAGQIQKTENWIVVLEKAVIHLRGSSTELRCSFAIVNSTLPAEEADAFIEMAGNIVRVALNFLLNVELPPAELG